jgi:hypothetical protein
MQAQALAGTPADSGKLIASCCIAASFLAASPQRVKTSRQNMSATAAAFAGSGHGILAGMSRRPRTPADDPMTLGNMRANGERSRDVSCWQCHHRAILSADP